MRQSVRPEETRVEMTQLILPPHTNNHGTVFGGQIAAWCDICASVAAQRFARRPVVTVSMDELHFMRPVNEGMILILQGQVNQAWGTSMEIGVRVETEVPLTGERLHCCSAYLTFVALDVNGRPAPVPVLDTSGDESATHRAEDAEHRRKHRLAMREEKKRRRGG